MRRRLAAIDRQVGRLRASLIALGDSRPGTVSRQYRDPSRRTGGSWQVSYTHRMQSHTEYVRAGNLGMARRQVRAYARFRQLVERWVDLG